MSSETTVFEGVTLFVLAVDEKESLYETIRIVSETCEKGDVRKIVIMLKSFECPSYCYSEKLIRDFPHLNIVRYVQKGANIVECMMEIPEQVEGSHFVILCSDMENYPYLVSDFISLAKERPLAVVSSSKWHKDSSVSKYGALRKFCSISVNRLIGFMFGYSGSDFFNIYKIYPRYIYDGIDYASHKDFVFEMTLLPLAKGVEYTEIPTVFEKRKSGNSHFKFSVESRVILRYIYTAIKLRFGK